MPVGVNFGTSEFVPPSVPFSPHSCPYFITFKQSQWVLRQNTRRQRPFSNPVDAGHSQASGACPDGVTPSPKPAGKRRGGGGLLGTHLQERITKERLSHSTGYVRSLPPPFFSRAHEFLHDCCLHRFPPVNSSPTPSPLETCDALPDAVVLPLRSLEADGESRGYHDDQLESIHNWSFNLRRSHR